MVANSHLQLLPCVGMRTISGTLWRGRSSTVVPNLRAESTKGTTVILRKPNRKLPKKNAEKGRDARLGEKLQRALKVNSSGKNKKRRMAREPHWDFKRRTDIGMEQLNNCGFCLHSGSTR